MALHPFRPQSGDFTGLSLCAGYAGLDLGLHIAEPNYRTVCYVEREAHAAATLVAREVIHLPRSDAARASH